MVGRTQDSSLDCVCRIYAQLPLSRSVDYTDECGELSYNLVPARSPCGFVQDL